MTIRNWRLAFLQMRPVSHLKLRPKKEFMNLIDLFKILAENLKYVLMRNSCDHDSCTLFLLRN